MLHVDIVRQTGFIESINSFLSVSETGIRKQRDAGIYLGGLGVQKKLTLFKMNGVGFDFLATYVNCKNSTIFSRREPLVLPLTRPVRRWPVVGLIACCDCGIH